MSQFPEEQTESGAFKRQEDAFRDWVKRDGSTPYPPGSGRYHLYVSFACPWAHRTIILRKLKGLEQTIGMTVVDPVRDERGSQLSRTRHCPRPVGQTGEAHCK
jgi:putative glutathione S-transferase